MRTKSQISPPIIDHLGPRDLQIMFLKPRWREYYFIIPCTMKIVSYKSIICMTFTSCIERSSWFSEPLRSSSSMSKERLLSVAITFFQNGGYTLPFLLDYSSKPCKRKCTLAILCWSMQPIRIMIIFTTEHTSVVMFCRWVISHAFVIPFFSRIPWRLLLVHHPVTEQGQIFCNFVSTSVCTNEANKLSNVPGCQVFPPTTGVEPKTRISGC
jgi:hypothetical protein